MNSLWLLALKNCKRNQKRNIATVAAIALGYAGILLLGSYVTRVKNLLGTSSIYLYHVGHFSIYKKNGLENHAVKPKIYNFSAEDQKSIFQLLQQDNDIEIVGRYLIGSGLAGNGCKTVPVMIKGVEWATEKTLRTHHKVKEHVPDFAKYAQGNPPWSADPSQAIAMALGLARLLDKETTLQITKSSEPQTSFNCENEDVLKSLKNDRGIQLAGLAYDGSFSVVDGELTSLFATGDDNSHLTQTLVPLSLLQKMYETDTVTYISVYLKNPNGLKDKIKDIQNKIKDLNIDVDIYPYTDENVNMRYTGTMSFLKSMAGFVGFVVLIVVTLSIINTMTLTVIERKREMGTLSSLGFSGWTIQSLFIKEAILLTVFGLLLGSLLTFITAYFVNKANILFTPPGVPGAIRLMLTPTWELCLMVAGPMFLFVILATYLTTQRVCHQKPINLITASSG